MTRLTPERPPVVDPRLRNADDATARPGGGESPALPGRRDALTVPHRPARREHRPAGQIAMDGVIARGTAQVGARFEVPSVEVDVGALLDRIDDGYARVGIGFHPGSRLGSGVSVPGRPGGRPTVYANSSIVIEDGRWVTDASRARQGHALDGADRRWLASTNRRENNDERTLIYLSDENGAPAELDGPLWFDPERIYMTGDGRILADVPCLPDSWFDLTEEITGQERVDPAQAGNLARALMPEPLQLTPRESFSSDDDPHTPAVPGGPEGPGRRRGSSAERPPQVQRILDSLAQDSFRIFGAGGTLRPGPIRLGSGEQANEGIFLNLARGPNGELSEVHTEGDLDRLTTRITAHFTSFDMNSGGTRVFSGAGSAEVEVVTRFQRGADGEFDFELPPQIEISVNGIDAEGVNLSTPGPGGSQQQFRIGRVRGSSDGAPEITIGSGVTRLDFDDVDLFDLHGAIEVAGGNSSIRLGRGDGPGQGVDIENVSLRYDSASRIFDLEGEPVDFESRVGSLELIDGDVADVELDLALGNGMIEIPGRSRFRYRSGEDGEMSLEALEPDGRFRFEGRVAEFELGRPAAEAEREPENQLSGVLNQVSLSLSDRSSGEISGRSLTLRPGQMPLMEDIEVDLGIEVEELGFPVGFEQPVRFFGGTGGRLTLNLDRQEGDSFVRGTGEFNATFGGEARARAQRIRGLEDALIDVRADGGDAELRGNINLTPEGGIRLVVEGHGRPTIDIQMQRGELGDTSALNDVERRFEELPPHERIEIEEPRPIPTGGRQTPLRVDPGDAVSALLDDGRLNVTLPMERASTGAFVLDLVEDRVDEDGDVDRVGPRVHIGDIRSGGGNAQLNLVFEGEGDDSRLDVDRSGITLDQPIEVNLGFQMYFDGIARLPIPEGNVYATTGRIRGVSFEDAGDGQVRVVPDIEIDSFRTSPILDIGGIMNMESVRARVGEELGGALIAEPLFGRETLPRDRDALVRALEGGAFGQAMGQETPSAADAVGALAQPRSGGAAGDRAPSGPPGEEIQPITNPAEMLAHAFPETEPVERDIEGELYRLAVERTADMSERQRNNILESVRRINRVFDVDGTTLRVRDDDGEGPIEVGDRRLELGSGQFIDLAPGTTLEVDVDPQEGLVLRGHAEIEALQVGNEGDDVHVELGRVSADLELRVLPVEGEVPIHALALSNFHGDVERLRSIGGAGAVDLRDARIGEAPNNVFTLRVGGGHPPLARFHLPQIDRAQISYQNDLTRVRPDWEDARLDIRSASVSNAALLFDGRTLSTLEPLHVEELDAYVSNIEEVPYEEQRVVLERARITGSGQVLLLPGGNIGVYGDLDRESDTPPTLQVEGITGAFDLVTTGPRARIPLLEDANLRGGLSVLQFGPTLGTHIEFGQTTFSGQTGEGEVIVGPDRTERETMQIANGRIIAEIEELRVVVPPEEMEAARAARATPRSEVYFDASYFIDGDFDKDFPPSEVQAEALENLGVQVIGGGAYGGRFMLSGAVLLEEGNFVVRNQATLGVRARALLEANGIDPIRIRDTVGRWLEDAIEAPPDPPGGGD